MKWKTPDRLVDLIVETGSARSKKGDAFQRRVMGRPMLHSSKTNEERTR